MHIPTFRTFPNDRVTTWIIRAIQVGALVALVAHDGDAQDSTAWHTPRQLIGFAVGRPGYREEALPFELATVAFTMTDVRPRRLGFDMSVGTMPTLLAFGIPVIGLRAGVVWPVPVVHGLTMLPGAGVSGIMGGSGGVVGANVHLSALIDVYPAAALRTGISVHQLSGLRPGAWLYEMGLAWFAP